MSKRALEVSKPKMSPHRLRQVAVAAMVDPRTVQRYLDGLPVRPSAKERIERVVRGDGAMELAESAPVPALVNLVLCGTCGEPMPCLCEGDS